MGPDHCGRGGPCSSPGCLPSPFLPCTEASHQGPVRCLKLCVLPCSCGWLCFSPLGQVRAREASWGSLKLKTQGGQILVLPGPHCGTLRNQFSSPSLSFLLEKWGSSGTCRVKGATEKVWLRVAASGLHSPHNPGGVSLPSPLVSSSNGLQSLRSICASAFPLLPHCPSCG